MTDTAQREPGVAIPAKVLSAGECKRDALPPDSAEAYAGDVIAEAPIVVVRQPGRRPLTLVLASALELGRDCDGLLIADNQASRRHVELTATAAGVLATDLGSTNGTFLDGERISTPVIVAPGARLGVGGTVIEVQGDEPNDTASPSGFDMKATSIDLLAEAVDRSPVDPSHLESEYGTITIVFSDIESSTERAVAMGDNDWYRVLGRHNKIIRRRLAEYRGTEIKNQGDGFMLTFPSARGAVRCMIAIQRDLADWLAEDPEAVRVRMGAHVGEAIHDGEGDIFGRHVNFAARVAGLAGGGQLLVSGMVKELVETRGDIAIGRWCTVELKGIDGSHTLYEVQGDADSSR